jgi:UDP-N-acetylmuramate--alanine ligase
LSLLINGTFCTSLHFAGILGSGMSALAQYSAWDGMRVSGSDRLCGSADVKDTQDRLGNAGCAMFPQDGSGAGAADAVVVSTAIEESNPDIAAARKRGIPVFHRSDVLAAIVETKKTIAVAGTSGKSTVAAMIWEFLQGCAKDASLITGAGLVRLEERGLIGNAYKGSSDLLVIEADESDGTCVKYKPYLSVFLNVSKDHKPVAETIELFTTLAQQSKVVITNADDRQLDTVKPSRTFGAAGTYAPGSVISVTPRVSFVRDTLTYSLPLPGQHNLSNLLAALSVCDFLGCSDAGLIKAAEGYKGVKRRFAVSTLPGNIRVIDDYAHNPEKIKAALQTAHGFAKRVLAVFQPHGFGPTRFLKNDLVNMFSQELTKEDMLFLLPIYYAGGTVQKDISSAQIVSLVKKHDKTAIAVKDRDELVSLLKQYVAPGDAVLVMGARDPSLSGLVEEIKRSLQDAN